MKNLPEKLEPGGQIEDKVTSGLINAMLAAIRRCLPPDSVKGARIDNGPNGWRLAIDPGRGGTSAPTHPFQIVQAPGEDNLIKIRYGTVNAVNVPTIGIDSDPLTIDIDDAANPTLELTGTATHYISLKVTLNVSFQVDTVQIQSATSAPADTTTEAYFTLGTVATQDDVITTINQNWLTNATYFYAGDDEHIFFL